jgi:hypothetical protein
MFVDICNGKLTFAIVADYEGLPFLKIRSTLFYYGTKVNFLKPINGSPIFHCYQDFYAIAKEAIIPLT